MGGGVYACRVFMVGIKILPNNLHVSGKYRNFTNT